MRQTGCAIHERMGRICACSGRSRRALSLECEPNASGMPASPHVRRRLARTAICWLRRTACVPGACATRAQASRLRGLHRVARHRRAADIPPAIHAEIFDATFCLPERNDAVYPVPRARRRHAADTALQFRVVPARPMSMSCCRNCAPTPRAAARRLDPAAADQTRIHRGLATHNAGAADRGNRRTHCDRSSTRFATSNRRGSHGQVALLGDAAFVRVRRRHGHHQAGLDAQCLTDAITQAGGNIDAALRATNASDPVRHPHRRARAAWAPIYGQLKPRAERGSGLRSGPKWCCAIGSPLVDIRGLESAPIMREHGGRMTANIDT